MSYELTIHIPDNSPQGHNIETLAEAEQITREEAALRLLASAKTTGKVHSGARRILGAFNSPEDAAAMDDALSIAMTDRQHRNIKRPHV